MTAPIFSLLLTGMMTKKTSTLPFRSLLFISALLLSLPALLFGVEPRPGLTTATIAATIAAITKPSSDVELSFVQAGKILAIAVAEGERVQAGALLARQEDELERIQLDLLTARANNPTPILLAKNELAQKDTYLDKLTTASHNGAVTKWEVEHADFARDSALLALQMAQFEHDQDLLHLKSVNEAIHRLQLSSPMNGIVENILVEQGESVQALQPVVRIVNIDPLELAVPVPLSLAGQLRIDQEALISYDDGATIRGAVATISMVADAAANIRTVTVMADNPAKRPAGERVKVSFPGTMEQASSTNSQ